MLEVQLLPWYPASQSSGAAEVPQRPELQRWGQSKDAATNYVLKATWNPPWHAAEDVLLSGRLLVRTDLPWLNSMFALQKGIIQVTFGATSRAYGALWVSFSFGHPCSAHCNSTTTSVFLNFQHIRIWSVFSVYNLCIYLLDVII